MARVKIKVFNFYKIYRYVFDDKRSGISILSMSQYVGLLEK